VTSELAIEVRGLVRSYRGRPAVREIDLSVRRGEVFALLGPNGAGKTTTVEILEGLRRRDAGSVSVLGFDPAEGQRAMRERIGIVLQSTGLDPYLSVAETMELLAAPYPRRLPAGDVLELVGIADRRSRRVGALSGGERRRLDVAVALCGDPDLLFLDEPTTGFDPLARRSAWGMVRRLAGMGRTVVLTTHFMDEAQHLADRIAIMADGRIVALGTSAELTRRTGGDTVVTFSLPSGAPCPPPDLPGDLDERDGSWTLVTGDPAAGLHALTGWALGEGLGLDDLEVRRPTLEDAYLRLTVAGRDGEAGG